MLGKAREIYTAALSDIAAQGLTKNERLILTPQSTRIRVGEREVLNFCANNYLGLSSRSEVVAAAKQAIDRWGYGLSSVRFICGTQDGHKLLERRLSEFFGYEDAILYSSCFDANGGLFETLLGEQDAVISDALNHASIIDGIRLCKAQRLRYANGDMEELERLLRETQGARLRMVATDGVFSMDGFIARIDRICDLAEQYGAMVMVDDSHASGFVGPTGRGSAEHRGATGRVDVMTSTLGKALGGAAGGFVCAAAPVIELLRQRSRPYLFSNTLAPAVVGASIAVLDLLDGSDELRRRLAANAQRFRAGMEGAGFTLKPGEHPIVPVMLGDARVAQEMARDLLEEGVYVVGFSFPVVPRGEARIRVQLSAAHSDDEIDAAIGAFTRVGRAHGVV